jgi:FixJ family two-component response regulator
MPIIFITGHGDVPMTVRAMKGGAVEFLTKPVLNDTQVWQIIAFLSRMHVLSASAQQEFKKSALPSN